MGVSLKMTKFDTTKEAIDCYGKRGVRKSLEEVSPIVEEARRVNEKMWAESKRRLEHDLG